MSKLWESVLNLFNFIGDNSGCHQIPERSFTVKGYTFPICARCTGVFLGQLSSVILILCGAPIRLGMALFMALIMFLDWSAQQLKLYTSNNLARCFVGFLGGTGIWSVMLKLLQRIYNVVFK